MPAAKRLIFNSKNQEAMGDQESIATPQMEKIEKIKSPSPLVLPEENTNYNENSENNQHLSKKGQENQVPNSNLVNNKERVEIFKDRPIQKANSPLPDDIGCSFASSSPVHHVIKEEIIEIELDSSGFEDLDNTDNQKDFDEYKAEDFSNYLHLKGSEEDSFACESELSVPGENVQRQLF